jgi:hypothetical protein
VVTSAGTVPARSVRVKKRRAAWVPLPSRLPRPQVLAGRCAGARVSGAVVREDAGELGEARAGGVAGRDQDQVGDAAVGECGHTGSHARRVAGDGELVDPGVRESAGELLA